MEVWRGEVTAHHLAHGLYFYRSTGESTTRANPVRRIPSNTKTIVLFSIDQAPSSELAVKEGWRDNHENEFAAGLAIVPPQARKFVMAAQLDDHTFQPKWSVAMMNLTPAAARPLAQVGTCGEMYARKIEALPTLNVVDDASDPFVAA